MKVVLLHDWLTGLRGGERVLEAFCEMFPEAPLYTLLHRPGSTSKIIEQRKITTSFLNNIPTIYTHYRKFLPLFPKAAASLKILEDADLLLSSSHCVIKGVKKPPRATHISYIHSPMRYLYDQYDHYFGKNAPLYQQMGAKLFKNYLVKWDLQSNQNVDYIVANSEFVRQRIKNFYHIDSHVIHPFVDLEDFKQRKKINNEEKKEDFYLMVTAFAPNKRVDLAISAFNKMGKTLKIIGSGQLEVSLKNLAQKNIHFLGNLPRAEVVEIFFKAQALIFPGVEDFGITPLEALAANTPVIAYKIGGVLETLNDSVAEFFTELEIDNLISAVKKFENRTYLQEDLWNRACQFSKEHFKLKIGNYIKEVMA